MPEGDSVYRVAARLRPAVEGRRLARRELRGGAAAGLRDAGMRVDGVETHGKHLLLRFDDGTSLHTHLLMQGSWSITRPGRTVPPAVLADVRVILGAEDGPTAWGVSVPVVELLPTREEHRVLGYLGPDPLRHDWDQHEAVRRLSRDPARPIVAALLDQRGMAGLGNLWANELCFLRGLFPWRPVSDVDLDGLVSLAARALRHSAKTPSAYQVTTGALRGARHFVAGRAGKPCLRCGTSIRVREEVRADPEQRRTWWCPRCQPER